MPINGYVADFRNTDKAPKKKNHNRAQKLLIAAVCLALTVWAIFLWNGHMRHERKVIDKTAVKDKIIRKALFNAKDTGATTTLGSFGAKLSSAYFVPDLDHPELHNYLVANWTLINPSSKPQDYEVICKIVDLEADYFPTAPLVGINIKGDSAPEQLAALLKSKKIYSSRRGTLQGTSTQNFTLVGDVQNSSRPYSLLCQARADQNTVTAWKLKLTS
jgi:hypothetical protein